MNHNCARFDFYIIIFLFITTGTVFLVRNYYHEPISDDLLYSFILDENTLGENQYVDKVETIGDAIESQYNQYFYSNGRFLIHVIVQMFAGPWGKFAFNFFNTAVLLLTILLFGKLTLTCEERRNALIWIGIAFTFLYLFQRNSNLFYFICGSLNYLVPMLFAVVFMLMYDRLISAQKIKRWEFPLLAVVGLVTGWSQECFSLPLAGAVFICILLNYRRSSIYAKYLSLFLFIGTAILVFAPGNFVRLSLRQSFVDTILNAIEYFFGTKLFWLAIISMVLVGLKGRNVIMGFYQHNKLYLLCWVLSCLLGCVANTTPQSFGGIAFYSAILLFRSVRYIPVAGVEKNKRGYVLTVSLVLLLITIHQSIIIRESKKMRSYNLEFLQRLISTPANEPVEVRDITIVWPARPYVLNWTNMSSKEWNLFTLRAFYIENLTYEESLRRPVQLLSAEEYEAYVVNSADFSGTDSVENPTSSLRDEEK